MEEADRKDRLREKNEAEKTVILFTISFLYFFSKESNKNYMRQENNKCMRRKEEWLNKLNKKEMSSKEFLLNKNYKENKNLKLKETDKLYFINMLQKFVNKFNLKKKKPSNKEQNILKKEENLTRNFKLKSLC